MGWALSFDAMREIDRIVRAQVKDPVGPEFMATRTPSAQGSLADAQSVSRAAVRQLRPARGKN
jgi:hypothetical protein